MWKCIINNEHCQDGWITTGSEVKVCQCVKIKAVNKAYLDFGGFEKDFQLPFSRLEDNNVKEVDIDGNEKAIQTYKELGAKMVDNLPKLIDLNAKIFINGATGSGKSQFVSSLAFEGAVRHEVMSYFLSANDLWDAIFDYGDKAKSKLTAIREKALHPSVKLLVIDDMGSEVPKGDNRLFELYTEYNKLIRNFQKDRNGVVVITSNHKPDKFKDLFKDQRLLAVLFQIGNTKCYEFSKAKNFRDNTKNANQLNFLD